MDVVFHQYFLMFSFFPSNNMPDHLFHFIPKGVWVGLGLRGIHHLIDAAEMVGKMASWLVTGVAAAVIVSSGFSLPSCFRQRLYNTGNAVED